jgi:hypothetical protein
MMLIIEADVLPRSSRWFILDVMREQSPKWDWVALMIDVHPEDLQSSSDKSLALSRAVSGGCRFLDKGDTVVIESMTTVGVCYRFSWAPYCYWSLPR